MDWSNLQKALLDSAKDLFPGREVLSIDKAGFARLFPDFPADWRKGLSFHELGDHDRFLGFHLTHEGSSLACAVRVPETLSKSEVYVAKRFLEIFVGDLAHAKGVVGPEPWSSLRQTQFVRVIAACLSFDPASAADWLTDLAAATSLAYERRPFRPTLLMLDEEEGAPEERFGGAYVNLARPIALTQALLEEKWIRSVIDGERMSLVCSAAREGRVIGFLSLGEVSIPDDPTPEPEPVVPQYPPHRSIIPLYQNLASTEALFATSLRGDLYVLSGGRFVFQRNQGRWRHVDYRRFHRALRSAGLARSLVRETVRLALDLSFEGKGALLVVLNEDAPLRALQQDCDTPPNRRANTLLRRAIAGLSLRTPSERDFITAAASADGAVIVGRDGLVRDAACMISANVDALNAKDPGVPGARSAAAWRASFHGIVLQVSEDGPISLWQEGRLVAATA